MRIEHRHQSFHARTAKRDPDAVSAALAKHRAECSVLTGTEAHRESWDRLLRAEGWTSFRADDGDYRGEFVTWDMSVWTRRAGYPRILSDVRFDGRLSTAAIAVLEHWKYPELNTAFVSLHLPAHIARLLRTTRATDPREKAWRESVDSLAEISRHLRRNHPDARQVFVGDWNVDFHNTWVRGRIRHAFRETDLDIASGHRTLGGTHGPRLIDWALTDLDSEATSTGITPASDHKWVEFVHRTRKEA